jgi:hypothetical protein
VAAYISLDLAVLSPEVRTALAHLVGRRVYIRDSRIRSITQAARNERIVEKYHAVRSAGVRKYAAFRQLSDSDLKLTLGPKQLGRIVAGHELECTTCLLLRPASWTKSQIGGSR